MSRLKEVMNMSVTAAVMAVVDKVMGRPAPFIVLGTIIGIVTQFLDLWVYIDPGVNFLTFAMAAVAAWQTKKAHAAYYDDRSNADERHVVALEVGRPISEAVKAKFGHLDILIRVQDVIGTTVLLTDEHYEKVARTLYSACARAQNKPIDLIVSGPNGLLLIVGQMLGLDRFRVAVYQYYNGDYQRVPRPTRDWLEHRD